MCLLLNVDSHYEICNERLKTKFNWGVKHGRNMSNPFITFPNLHTVSVKILYEKWSTKKTPQNIGPASRLHLSCGSSYRHKLSAQKFLVEKGPYCLNKIVKPKPHAHLHNLCSYQASFRNSDIRYKKSCRNYHFNWEVKICHKQITRKDHAKYQENWMQD